MRIAVRRCGCGRHTPIACVVAGRRQWRCVVLVAPPDLSQRLSVVALGVVLRHIHPRTHSARKHTPLAQHTVWGNATGAGRT